MTASKRPANADGQLPPAEPPAAPDLSESVAGEEDPGAALDLPWPDPPPPAD